MLSHLTLPLALAMAGSVLAARQVTDAECDCYEIKGEPTNYFQRHLFFDFRSMSDQVKTDNHFPQTQRESANAGITADYFNTSQWTDYWELQNWSNNGKNADGMQTIPLQYSLANVYLSRNTDSDREHASDTYLVLRTANHNDRFTSGAEMQSKLGSYHFGSLRMMARTRGAPGACTALFTYRPPKKGQSEKVQEADIEILTNGPDEMVQYTNQPSTHGGESVPDATRNATLPENRRWSQWRELRLDWSPGTVSWYADGHFVTSISYQAPRDPAYILLNSWSDGGSWSGRLPTNGAATLEVQWIQMAFNISDRNAANDNAPERRALGRFADKDLTESRPMPSSPSSNLVERSLMPRAGQKCLRVCAIDQPQTRGQPMLIHEGAAPSARVSAVSLLLAAAVALFLW